MVLELSCGLPQLAVTVKMMVISRLLQWSVGPCIALCIHTLHCKSRIGLAHMRFTHACRKETLCDVFPACYSSSQLTSDVLSPQYVFDSPAGLHCSSDGRAQTCLMTVSGTCSRSDGHDFVAVHD